MSPFTPKREDGRPQWQVLYDYLAEGIDAGRLKIGDVIPHAELAKQLGDGVNWQSPLRKAGDVLREKRQRSLEAVRGEGYRLIHGIDHVKQGKRKRRSANRALVRSHAVLSTVDRTALSLSEVEKLDLTLAATATVVRWAKETDTKVAKMETDLARLEGRQKADREDVLRRLEALESKP